MQQCHYDKVAWSDFFVLRVICSPRSEGVACKRAKIRVRFCLVIFPPERSERVVFLCSHPEDRGVTRHATAILPLKTGRLSNQRRDAQSERSHQLGLVQDPPRGWLGRVFDQRLKARSVRYDVDSRSRASCVAGRMHPSIEGRDQDACRFAIVVTSRRFFEELLVQMWGSFFVGVQGFTEVRRCFLRHDLGLGCVDFYNAANNGERLMTIITSDTVNAGFRNILGSNKAVLMLQRPGNLRHHRVEAQAQPV